jgi:hypothetical protein
MGEVKQDRTQQPLSTILLLVGLVFIFAIIPLMQWWPSGWQWQPKHPEYEQMIQGVYATLGIFLVIASRNPASHRSLIAFTAWSSIVHAGIMTIHAVGDPMERGHLWGDIPGLVIVGVALLSLAPRSVDD